MPITIPVAARLADAIATLETALPDHDRVEAIEDAILNRAYQTEGDAALVLMVTSRRVDDEKDRERLKRTARWLADRSGLDLRAFGGRFYGV